MSFEGFQAPNQHTQTPNEFFDEILLTKGITLAEVKLLGFMIRNTFGWQRAGNTLVFTFTQLQKSCYLGRQAVNHAIQKCLDKGYIERKEIAGEYHYRLKIKDYDDYPWELKFDWTKVQKRKEKKDSDGQFENQTSSSSKIKPVVVRKSNRQQFENQTAFQTESIEPVEKQPLLNKSLNKKIKYNLSIHKEIETSDLPIIIKKTLIHTTDRLIKENINILDIFTSYNSHKEQANNSNYFDYYFADILRRILEKTKSKIRNIQDLINTAISNDVNQKNKDKYLMLFKEQKRRDVLLNTERAIQDDEEDTMSQEELEKLREQAKKAIKELLES